MLDRQKIETILTRRFSAASASDIAAAANAIMGLGDEWEEILEQDRALGHHTSADCRDVCYLAQEFECGAAFRLFRRQEPDRDRQTPPPHREITVSSTMRSSAR
jgi:hypothetical protein